MSLAEKSAQRIRNGTIVLLLWTLFGLISSGHFFVREDGPNTGAFFGDLASHILLFYWAWAALTPIVVRIVGQGRAWREWRGIVVAAPVLVLLHGMLYLGLERLTGVEPHASISPSELLNYVMRHAGGDVATLGVLVGSRLLFVAVRRAREREVAAAELQTRLARADLELLRWQLHPHFLFNALNTVSTLILRGANADAEDAIARMSRYLRTALDQRADTLVTVEEELVVVRQYVAIEMLRFGEGLDVTTTVNDDALAARIPSLLLQPLVENAIHHGSARGVIFVSGSTAGGRLQLRVANPGDAPVIGNEGFGLGYVRQRLRHFYGDDASLSLASVSGETVVTLEMPCGVA